MSKIALSPNAGGTATFTIAAPGTNTDRTLNLPDAAGTVFVGGQALSATTGSFSGNVTLGSSVLETPSGSAPAYLCRAWVNFDGTGSIAIRGSGNVSSITRFDTTGSFTISFATAMPDASYSAVGDAVNSSSFVTSVTSAANNSTTATFIRVTNMSGTLINPNFCSYAFFR